MNVIDVSKMSTTEMNALRIVVEKRTRAIVTAEAKKVYPGLKGPVALQKLTEQPEGAQLWDEVYDAENDRVLKAWWDNTGPAESVAMDLGLTDDLTPTEYVAKSRAAADKLLAESERFRYAVEHDPLRLMMKGRDLDAAMQKLEKEYAIRHGCKVEKAADILGQTDDAYKALYAKKRDLDTIRSAQIQKNGGWSEDFGVEGRVKKSADLYSAIQKSASDTGMTEAEFLDTPAGREAYRKYRESLVPVSTLREAEDFTKIGGDVTSQSPLVDRGRPSTMPLQGASFSGAVSPPNRTKQTGPLREDEVQRAAIAMFPDVTPAKAYAKWLESDEGRAYYSRNYGVKGRR